MGHILPGTQDTYYDKTKVDELRRKYAKVNFFPERGGLTEDARKRQMVDMAKVLGYSEDKIKKIEDVLARYENVDEAIQELRRLKEEPDEKTATAHGRNGEYFVVRGEDELIHRLHDGWRLIQPLNDEKYLLQN